MVVDDKFIEALPGTRRLVENFKLIYRPLDVKKVQAEIRTAELYNLRVVARLENIKYGDPHIDKMVVVEIDQNVTVDAGWRSHGSQSFSCGVIDE